MPPTGPQMLARMYLRWAEAKGFATQIVDESPAEEAGLKSITFFVRGRNAYGMLESERGVHRLVRLSPFDAAHRRHTSFAAVDVIPEVEAGDELDVEIKPDDLRIETFKSGGAGGQYVNKTESAVRVIHLPTGIIVASQQERSQAQNRDVALNILRAKLVARAAEERDRKLADLRGERQANEWGSQIRSYVLQPYQLVKDHRTGVETGNVAEVLDGNIDTFIWPYLQQRSHSVAGVGVARPFALDRVPRLRGALYVAWIAQILRPIAISSTSAFSRRRSRARSAVSAIRSKAAIGPFISRRFSIRSRVAVALVPSAAHARRAAGSRRCARRAAGLRIVRARSDVSTARLAALVAWLYPPLAGLIFGDFHENGFAPAAVAWTLYAFDSGYLAVAVVGALVTLSIKEDQALFLAIAGALGAWRFRGTARGRVAPALRLQALRVLVAFFAFIPPHASGRLHGSRGASTRWSASGAVLH